ncbi:MAG: 2-dehydropantoate 2-reductase [Alphaproteobacteria bacterium]|nr:2-dehydropantoate 2-reductase [Alphaproteobacteria bacterium]
MTIPGPPLRVAVVGAGCIGCWLGGRLAQAGAQVVLIGRRRLQEAVATDGLSLQPLSGPAVHPTPAVQRDPAFVAGADIVLITTKGSDTVAAAEEIAPHLVDHAVLVSFQNGLKNPDRLRRALPGRTIVPAMVSYNVVWAGPAAFRQATSGPLAIAQDAPPGLVAGLRAAGESVHLAADMQRVQWAKLLLNLNNAVNALSGLPLATQLGDQGYRRVLAAAMKEAWACLRAAGIEPAPIGRMRPSLAPRILPLPDWLFRVLAAPMIRIDPAARSSMADDLDRGRRTEVDDINGEVVALGAQVGVPTPINARLVELVHQAESSDRGSPRLAAQELWPVAAG